MSKPPRPATDTQQSAALTKQSAPIRRDLWLEENAAAIECYNGRVDRDGLSTKGLRRL